MLAVSASLPASPRRSAVTATSSRLGHGFGVLFTRRSNAATRKSFPFGWSRAWPVISKTSTRVIWERLEGPLTGPLSPGAVVGSVARLRRADCVDMLSS